MPKDQIKHLANQITYLKRELVTQRQQRKELHEQELAVMADLDTRFAHVFGGVVKELKLLRTTLVLLQLAGMPNKMNRKAFLKMVDFVKQESDFQEFADDMFAGLLDTKILGDML